MAEELVVEDRRTRRRRETIEEILAIAEDVMGEVGVNGLSLSEVARRLGVKPPSIYKYFDSLMAIYDTLFERGQREHLAAMQDAMAGAEPGLAALSAGLEASCRWCIEHPATAQLMFWRPVPSFEPTAEAMAPSVEMVELQRQALADAVDAGQLGPGAKADDAVFMVSILVSGLIGQAMANEPGVPWGEGLFTGLFPKTIEAIPAVYPPAPGRGRKATR